MEPVKFLTIKRVVHIHILHIIKSGGIHGIRDIGLLESAINTPQASFDGVLLHPDIPSQAAAYVYHIVKNHPFLDGNKRTGSAAMLIFLKANGKSIPWSKDELFELTMRVAMSQISKDELIEEFNVNYLPTKTSRQSPYISAKVRNKT